MFAVMMNVAAVASIYLVLKTKMGSRLQLAFLMSTGIFGIAACVTDIYLIRGL